MDIQKLIIFFMWCTIINAILMTFGTIAIIFAPDLVYNIHCQLFHISRENINEAIYLFFAGYKVFWLVFNAVPLVALLIVRKKYQLN